MKISYAGPEIDDHSLIDRLPHEISSTLFLQNGYITANGGLHVRGACLAPEWHSLADAWTGVNAVYRLYPSINAEDIPLAEDCFGDQFLLRDSQVIRLSGETGSVEMLNVTWSEFLQRVDADSVEYLSLQALVRYRQSGRNLQPGELLSVYPPFVTTGGGASLKPVPAVERRLFLADFARQISGLKDGQRIRIEV